jgi:hypothetical protein
VAVSPRDNVTQWRKIAAKSRLGAKPTANAMAEYIAWRAKEITLRRTLHPPGAYNRAKGGESPAYGSGTLARAMYVTRAYDDRLATAYVRNSAPYSRITEFGCVVSAEGKDKLHWADSAGSWFHTVLKHEDHPFLEPTVDESIDDGSLRDEAIDAFIPYDP